MEKLVIGVDMDGVLANFNKAYRERLQLVTGRELIPYDFVPSTWFYATEEFGYTKEEDNATWKSITSDVLFWNMLYPYPSARPFLQSLLHSLDEVYFITTRPGRLVKLQSEMWLRRLGYVEPTVLIAEDAESKGLLAKGLGLTHFLDDRPENCLAVRRHSPATEVYLLDYPYNRWADTSLDYASVYTRIRTLGDFENALRQPRLAA